MKESCRRRLRLTRGWEVRSMSAGPTDALRAAVNDWKAKFEKTRWEQWESLSDEEKRHAVEHTKDSYITGLTYPFVKRPAECPLSLYEIGIALWVSEGDFYEAAVRLRVSPERLATAINNVPEFKKYAPNLKQQKRDAGEPLVEVIPRDAGINFDIRISGLSRDRNYSVNWRADGDTLVLTVDRQPTKEQAKRLEELYRRALEVVKEGKSGAMPEPSC
jgi:hypothetical protein